MTVESKRDGFIDLSQCLKSFRVAICRAQIDGAFRCSDREAVEMGQYLLHKEGLFVGSSSCVNCVGAAKAAQLLPSGSTVVTILCDSGERHLSKFHDPDYLRSVGLEPSAACDSLDFICHEERG